jgi:hypothetical protein
MSRVGSARSVDAVTISHAAVVLPFARLLVRWRLLSAFVIGAMVPDFGLFFPWRIHRFETHSALALLTFCLPVGLTTYWAFQYLIKAPMLEVLPEGAYSLFPAGSNSLNFPSPQYLARLPRDATKLGLHAAPSAGFHVARRGRSSRSAIITWRSPSLQDGSSLFGLVVVIGLVGTACGPGRSPSARPPVRAPERRAWVAAYIVAAIGLSVAWLLWARVGEPAGRSHVASATRIAVAALRGLATALLIMSLALDGRLRALARRCAHRPP